MQLFPPWPLPADYCRAVNSWTVLDLTDTGQGNLQEAQACHQDPTTLSNCQEILSHYTYSVWSSDHVFCLDRTTQLWMLFLALAGMLWLVFTIVRLFHTFDWRGGTGFSMGEVVKAVAGQLLLMIVAVCSFAILLQIHQANFLLINSLLGGLPNQRVDSLWGRLSNLLSASETATQNLDPNAWANGIFGGNLPDNTAPFGLTWGQIFGGLGSTESFLLSALLPVRFTAQFVAVGTAPLAILAYGLPATRRFFWIWFEFWLEIEALAAGSAIVLAAYQTLATPLTSDAAGLSPTEKALILLSFAGLVCVGNFAFLWKILGSFLTNATSFYQQQYQRERQFWGILGQAALGLGGAAATIISGGTALPFVLAAEGALAGVEELGAQPAAPVPGSGMGHSFFAAGATWRGLAQTGTGAGNTPGSGVPTRPLPGGAGGTLARTSPGGAGTAPSPALTAPRSSANAAPVPVNGAQSPVTGHLAQAHPQPPPLGVAFQPSGSGGSPAGSGAFAGLPALQTSPLAVTQGAPLSTQNAIAAREASVRAVAALPAVLAQMPLGPSAEQRLLAPWHNGRGEAIDPEVVYRAYFRNAADPTAPLHSSFGGRDFLQVQTTDGLVTGVPLDVVERRLSSVPYLRDTLELHRRAWISPEQLTPVAQALGTLYHAQPGAYPAHAQAVQDFLEGTHGGFATDPAHGFQALLRFIADQVPHQRGGHP